MAGVACSLRWVVWLLCWLWASMIAALLEREGLFRASSAVYGILVAAAAAQIGGAYGAGWPRTGSPRLLHLAVAATLLMAAGPVFVCALIGRADMLVAGLSDGWMGAVIVLAPTLGYYLLFQRRA